LGGKTHRGWGGSNLMNEKKENYLENISKIPVIIKTRPR
jgi:hypothetical protein